MNIDTIIAEATAPVAIEQAATQEVAPSESPDKSEVETTQEPAKEDLSTKTDDELTPEQLARRINNRKSHENSKLAELRRAKRELLAENALLKQQSVPQPKPQANDTGKPVIDNFETWEDYTEALADWKIEQKFSSLNKQAEQTQAVQSQNLTQAQRTQEIAQAEAEFAKSTPEYAQLVDDNQGFFSNITKELAIGLSEAENPQLAIFALMKEDRLDDLYDMTPTRLAAELARAEIRGQSYLSKPKPTSNAPAPITPSRGNTVGGKSIEKLDGVSLLKAIRST